MIDKTPVVGRFLFTESMLRDGFFARAGTITKISGKRVYFDATRDCNAPKEGYIHIKSLAAVCDTPDEIAALQIFNRRALDEITELKNKHKAEAARFFA